MLRLAVVIAGAVMACVAMQEAPRNSTIRGVSPPLARVLVVFWFHLRVQVACRRIPLSVYLATMAAVSAHATSGLTSHVPCARGVLVRVLHPAPGNNQYQKTPAGGKDGKRGKACPNQPDARNVLARLSAPCMKLTPCVYPTSSLAGRQTNGPAWFFQLRR